MKSFLKTVIAFTLIAFLTFGSAYVLNAVASGNSLTGSYDATGNDATGNNQVVEKVKLGTPTDLAFTDFYCLKFKGVDNCKNYYYEMYKDSAIYDTGSWGVGQDTNVELCTSRYMTESGTYKFRVRSEAYYDDKVYTNGDWSDFSEEVTYVRPEAEVGVATITWRLNETGKFDITLPDNTGAYIVRSYYAAKEGDELCEVGSHWFCPSYGNYKAGTVVTEDILSDIQKNGAGVYGVSVQVLSNDMKSYAHGKESEIIIYNTSKAMAAANAKLEEVLADIDAPDFNANEAVEALVESLPIEDLQIAMQCDAKVIEKVQKLEEKIIEKNNITVETPKVSEEVNLDVSKISVTGAAFNTAPNTTVALSVAKPEKEVEVTSQYRNPVQIDIKLVADDTEIHQLKVPVTVTIPVPEGLNIYQLVILHHKADGSVERIVPLKNTDGTMSFTVTEFSTFVIAEEEVVTIPDEIIEEDSNTNPGTGSSSNSSNSSSSSNATPAPAKVKVLKPIIHKVVVGDTLNKIAAKYGVTLKDILTWNKIIRNPNIIFRNQEIIVGFEEVEVDAVETPETEEVVNPEYYIVKRGDTLFGIAIKNKLSLGQLKALNPGLFKQKFIFANQKVRIK